MTTSNNIVAAGTYHSDKFEYVNQKLREHFQRSQDEIEEVKQHVNELVVIVHNDNKDWSLKKICEYIAGKNDDLEEFGFSSRTIYRYLNDENRQLIDKSKQKTGKELQNNVIEDDDDTCHHIVPEESSRTKTLPTAYEVKDAEIGEAVDEIYDIEDDDDDDDDDQGRIIQFKYVLTIKDQDLPLIVTCYPDMGTGKVELDEKEARKLKRF